MPKLVVYGAAGFTGRLVVQALLAAGLDELVLGGRSAERLQRVAADHGDLPFAVAATDDEPALDRLCAGARVVISSAGPFEQLGEPLVRAALRAGAHFLDTTGEQGYMRRMLERHAAAARERSVAVINAHGFEYALGYCAGALAAQALPGAERLDVFNRVSRFGTTRGTQKSALGVVLDGDAWHRRGARLSPFPAFTAPRRVRVPGVGKSELAVAIPGGEALHLARSCATLTAIDTHLVVPAALAWPMTAAWLARPLLAALVGERTRVALERRIDAGAEGPSDAARERVRFAVLARAQRGDEVREVCVRGADVYGVTGVIVATGARMLCDGAPRATGVVSTDQAFGARPFLDALAAHGVETMD